MSRKLALTEFSSAEVPLLVQYLNAPTMTQFMSSRLPQPYTTADAMFGVKAGSEQGTATEVLRHFSEQLHGVKNFARLYAQVFAENCGAQRMFACNPRLKMVFMLRAILLSMLCTSTFAAEQVVLLHGLGRTENSMNKMEKALQDADYATCNIEYPSTKLAIAELAIDSVLPQIRECVADSQEPVHFVTHSMGGIVLRYLSVHEKSLSIGRAVMLGPPNHGSEVVDKIGHWGLFKWFNGAAGQELTTRSDSMPNQLGAASFPVGIIAGSKPFFEPFAGLIEGDSDGKVSVESAKLDGMQAFLVLPVTHSLMMRDTAVIANTIEFLSKGEFVTKGSE